MQDKQMNRDKPARAVRRGAEEASHALYFARKHEEKGSRNAARFDSRRWMAPIKRLTSDAECFSGTFRCSSVYVSPGVEREAVCVGTVGSWVVHGRNGVSEQPHPRSDVHVHLAGTQEGLAWKHTHTDAHNIHCLSSNVKKKKKSQVNRLVSFWASIIVLLLIFSFLCFLSGFNVSVSINPWMKLSPRRRNKILYSPLGGALDQNKNKHHVSHYISSK